MMFMRFVIWCKNWRFTLTDVMIIPHSTVGIFCGMRILSAKGNGTGIDSPAKRRRLEARKNPHWVGIAGGRGGVSLGYRKTSDAGSGTWIAKIVLDGKRKEERLGPADDTPGVKGGLTYSQAAAMAHEWARERAVSITEVQSDPVGHALTVRAAVTAYVTSRMLRGKRVGKDSEGRLGKHVLADGKIADLHLSRVTATALLSWRERLPTDMAASGKNRLFNDFRAALNLAARIHRRALPAHLPGEVKEGLRAEPEADIARRQILNDSDVRRVVEAAFGLPDDGDFGRLALVLAATGARFSQIAALTIADVQADALRIMVPRSKKGRTNKARGKVPVPVGQDVIDALQPAIAGRAENEPLFLHWLHRQTGPVEWERISRSPWKIASDVVRPWRRAVAAAGLPAETIMYALRHSSIVRGLRAGLPVRLVASLHDTSVAMIEKHYSAYIADAAEDIARRAVTALYA